MSGNASPTSTAIKVVLADSHALFRDSLRAFLMVSGIEVPVVAANDAQALAAARAARFDVALIDLHLDGVGGIETTRRMAMEWPELPILLLATSRFDSELQEGVRSGASGYLFKGEDPEVVLGTIVAIARGTPILSPELARWLLRAFGGPDGGGAATGSPPLSREESKLLAEIEAGSRAEIAGSALSSGILAKLHRRFREGRA